MLGLCCFIFFIFLVRLFLWFQGQDRGSTRHGFCAYNSVLHLQGSRRNRTGRLQGVRDAAGLSQFHERGQLHRHIHHSHRSARAYSRDEHDDRQEPVLVQKAVAERISRRVSLR